MTAGKYDITIEQGATFTLAVTWKDSDGDPFLMRDVSEGRTVRMKIKDGIGGEEIDSFTGVYNGDVVNFPSDSIIRLYGDSQNTNPSPNIEVVVHPSTTDTYDFDDGVYDIESENSSGDVQRVVEGRVKLKLSVTR